ncbi:MAG TPA: hypothetical protein VLL76_05875, partial [Candidatus Omnitrophota bacterium]|nr:hypothetical protein [Candidatus Omnitrophota bacterium]
AMQLCAENGIRFDVVIPIALSCVNWADGGLPDAFIEHFFDDWLEGSEATDKAVQPLIKCLPAFAELLEREDFDELDAHHVADWMIEKGHLGILAMVSTPVRKYTPEGRSWTESWSNTAHTWLYGETLEDLFVAAGEWAEGKVKRWIAQWGGLTPCAA